MTADFEKNVEHMGRLLSTSTLNWLLGAGVSFESNIPLMYPLTTRVASMLQGEAETIYSSIQAQLKTDSHVEHVLSHLGDLIAIAGRVRDGQVLVGENNWTKAALENAHRQIISAIGTTVRYGYRAAREGEAERSGGPGNNIVSIEAHLNFVRTLLDTRSNLESRSKISFFTTNYDTLLEDSLCLAKKIPIDGFEGGALGYWNPLGSEQKRLEADARAFPVYKLHGSVDWVADPDYGLVRCRYDVNYLSSSENLLIYPQATKYVETQKDPFAYLFSCFRQALASSQSHVLAIIGYSFGDEHINNEIEHALLSLDNKTCIVAFVKEREEAGGHVLPVKLDEWRMQEKIASRIYIATNKALYWNSQRFVVADENNELDWWSFSGLTRYLKNGRVI